MQAVRLAKLIFQAISIVIFAYQSILAVRKFSTVSSIPTVETVDISDAKLPAIYICLKDTTFEENFEEQGYYTFSAFRDGRLANLGIEYAVSWEGNNSLPYRNLTRKVVKSPRQNYFFISGNPSESWVFPTKGNTMELGNGLVEMFTALDGTCVKVDINATEYFQSQPFSVKIQVTDEVHIFLTDPQTNLFYKINTDSMTGDPIASEQGFTKTYLVEFEEIHWLEESGECTNYGEATEFKSFADCVADQQEKIFRPILGCQVPWLTAPDDPDICKGRVELSYDTQTSFKAQIPSVFTNIEQMKIDDQFRACLKPCLKLKANSELRTKANELSNFHTTVLSFQKRVKVTKYLNAYGLVDLVVEAGSSLGLWIGLSALGVFDLFMQAGDALLTKTKGIKW